MFANIAWVGAMMVKYSQDGLKPLVGDSKRFENGGLFTTWLSCG